MAMLSLGLLSFLCFLFTLIFQAIADRPSFKCFNDTGNYTDDSTYATNLNATLSRLTSNTQIDYGFYNISYGQNSDKVYAIGWCRGDISPNRCRSCLNDTITLPQLCPRQKEAIAWFEECFLRYTNRSIFGVADSTPYTIGYRVDKATDEQFNRKVSELLINLRRIAASGDSRRKVAAGNTTLNLQTIYGLVQCTPDLTEQNCTDCLVNTFEDISTYFEGHLGGVVYTPSCRARYEIYSIYDQTGLPSPPPPPPQAFPPPPSSNNTNSTLPGKSKTSHTVIAITLPIVAFVVLSLLIFFCYRAKKRKPRGTYEIESDDEIKTADQSLQFNFDTIRVATTDFSEANKLGEGGFGAVYRGKLPGGKEIAVKRLSRNSSQGDIEFKNEVLLVVKLQHRNLVRLLGFCLEGRERLLVYEFVPNKSLDCFIFDPTMRAQLDWLQRYKIIGGIARGLLYLHEESRLRIIHRDLKASNILLDEEMNPKISDFGMARLFDVDQTQDDTSTIVGTYGYMAPEYAMHGQFSIKSDIFSFGVLLLEIVSGHKNNSVIHNGENVEYLLSFAWKNWRQGTPTKIVDPTLNIGLHNETMRCIHIGLLCAQEDVVARPTMAAVVLMLNSHSFTLPVPSKPAFFIDNNPSFLDMQPLEFDSAAIGLSESRDESAGTQESLNECTITELYAR